MGRYFRCWNFMFTGMRRLMMQSKLVKLNSSVQDTMAPVSSSKTEGITTDENIFNEVDICRFTWKQRCTHR